MAQKRVTFEVANAIKSIGYPQVGQRYQYTYEGNLVDLVREGGICYGPVAPTYLDVWLWLWREKKISIDIEHLIGNDFANFVLGRRILTNGQYQTDPEEAIEAAIKYLVDNNLIK